MCNLYSITTNQAAIAARSASSTAMSATSRRCPASSLVRDGLGYGRRDADHAGTSDRHRRGDHTNRHHAQRIEVKRDAGAPCPCCKNDINGQATVCRLLPPGCDRNYILTTAHPDRPLFAFAGIWTTFDGIAARSRSRCRGRIRSMAFYDDTERGGRADPSQGNAGYPDDRRRT